MLEDFPRTSRLLNGLILAQIQRTGPHGDLSIETAEWNTALYEMSNSASKANSILTDLNSFMFKLFLDALQDFEAISQRP